MEIKTILKTDHHTLHFKFLFVADFALCLKYSYENYGTWYRGRSRKIYTSKKGRYFIHQRSRVYFSTNELTN